MTFLTSLNREGEGANALPSPLEAFTMIDLHKAKDIEVQITSMNDGLRIWVNVEGKCLFRAYHVGKVDIFGPDNLAHGWIHGARLEPSNG